jgi:glycosyltransferase involved in cell wall biosynthesis
MRILACSEHYAPVGGAEIYLLDAITRLEEMGHEVGVMHDTPAGENLEDVRPHCHIPGSMGFIHDKSATVVDQAKTAVREFQPDLIYLNQVMNPSVNFALLEEAPIVQYVHGLRLTCPTGRRLPRTWDGICTKPFDAHCLWKAHTQRCMPRRPDTALRVWNDVRRNIQAARRMNRILVASRYVRDLLVAGGTSPDLIEILPLYADLTSKAENTHPSRGRQILALGRHSSEKGFDCLIETLAFIKGPASLELVGGGEYLKELRLLAKKVPDRHTVRFSEWIPREAISDTYARARVVAVPSVTPETFGLVGLEAMAHGLPVVGFDVGGIPDWLTDGETGALVQRKDIPALAMALDRYLSDLELANRHGEAGRERVRQSFLAEHHFDRLSEVLEEAAFSPSRVRT